MQSSVIHVLIISRSIFYREGGSDIPFTLGKTIQHENLDQFRSFYSWQTPKSI